MKYLLDTYACIAHLRGTNANVTNQLAAAAPGDVVLSSVVKAELRYGVERSANPIKNHVQVQSSSPCCPPFSFSKAAYAEGVSQHSPG